MKEINEKPPLGVTPRILWLEQRAYCLSSAIVRDIVVKGGKIMCPRCEEYFYIE